MERRPPRGTDNNGLLLGNLADGTRVGEFVIEARLGARGTGHLYAATHLVLPRRATIHVLPPAEGPARTVALELLRAACIVDAIDHPGMPRVFECGMFPDHRPWIASERIEGQTVATMLDSRRVSLGDVIAIVRDVAAVIAEAHRRGLVHGHITPAAIVFTPRGRRFPICLVDWVGARTHDSTAPLPLVVGSPYVAPEQANGIRIDDRSDVYSLGRIGSALLDCVTGDEQSPMLVALLDSMTADDRDVRPASEYVEQTAAWLAGQLPAQPVAVAAERSAPITSEVAIAVAGEIAPR
ncbi:MAG TPA: hypothetical protein VFV99_15640 [Kofleriaceae bacterium]|nr:hypothetical protein [Kofleriaceae bacterium]